MPVIQRIVKPSTHKGKRFLMKREPKIIENIKQTLFIPGRKVSDTVSKFVKDLYLLKKPDAMLLTKKNEILPFEDINPIEQLCRKYDSSLFIFASHNKKRPNNLVIGRTFDSHLLDMFEFGVDSYSGDLISPSGFKPSIGVKPCLLFIGEEFEQIHHLKRLRSLLVDIFHRKEIKQVPISGLEYVITFTALDGEILLRTYRILPKHSGEKSPRIELENMGPNANLKFRRKVLASNDLFKRACNKPKTKGKKIKNIERDVFGSKLGRVHMVSQDVNKLQTRKMKGLRKTAVEKKEQRKRKSENSNDTSRPVKKNKIT